MSRLSSTPGAPRVGLKSCSCCWDVRGLHRSLKDPPLPHPENLSQYDEQCSNLCTQPQRVVLSYCVVGAIVSKGSGIRVVLQET